MEVLNLDYMGPMLKEARLEAGLTQDEVAERIGITTRYLMAIENEGKCPALDVWFLILFSDDPYFFQYSLHCIRHDDASHTSPNGQSCPLAESVFFKAVLA